MEMVIYQHQQQPPIPQACSTLKHKIHDKNSSRTQKYEFGNLKYLYNEKIASLMLEAVKANSQFLQIYQRLDQK